LGRVGSVVGWVGRTRWVRMDTWGFFTPAG